MRLWLGLFLALWPSVGEAAIFIVRHAERADAMNDASLLSAFGKRRAAELAQVLSSVALKAVYCTEYGRTRQTAAPAASARNLLPTETRSEDVQGLARALRERDAEEDVLVVGHTDTIPDLLKLLGVEHPVAIEAGDYDNLFVVSLGEKAPRFHWLHYGAPSKPRKR